MYYIVYETTNTINGMKYRGCHATENLCDGYLGSGIYFKRALKQYGKKCFTRKILCICETPEKMITKEVELVNEIWVSSNNTYNLQTGGLQYGILSDSSKEKISKSVAKAHKDNKFDYTKLKGRDVWNKGKSNVYSEVTLSRMSETRKGNIPWNKGKIGAQEAWNKCKASGPMDDETKEKISKSLKKRYEQQPHHLKGTVSPNRGRKMKDKPWNYGKTLDKDIKCPHCDVMGGSMSNMKRWHFDNCKKLLKS